MEVIAHRINTVGELRALPLHLGAEIDLRAYGEDIILNHEPFTSGCSFKEYVRNYRHGLMVLNVKEAGIEKRVIEIVEDAGIKDYFLLDVEFPFIYRSSREGFSKIAMRYSEDESLETVLKYQGMVDWVWIDTNTMLPIDKAVVEKLRDFKTCVVCPERWGRPQDIDEYKHRMMEVGFIPDAVMTNLDYVDQWGF